MVRGPVKIFVASPGDVKAEREICRKLIKEWKDGKIFDIESFFWEDDALPGFGSYTQEVISKQSLQADRNGSEFDIVIVMVWSRLGTETKYFLSGTAEELIIALLNSYPSPTRVMLYCSDVPIKPSRIVPEQLAGVNSLRSCCKDAGGLLFPYESVKKFDRLEPISKLSEQDNEAGELDKAEEVLSVEFPADEYAALPLYPGKETLDEPASHIAA